MPCVTSAPVTTTRFVPIRSTSFGACGAVTMMPMARPCAAAMARSYLELLYQPALEIARGKFGTQVQVETRNELGELANTFNYMSQQLLAQVGAAPADGAANIRPTTMLAVKR